MSALSINAERLLSRIRALDEIGRDSDGRLVRLAASDADVLLDVIQRLAAEGKIR